MKKIIFLDIDGVLNYDFWNEKHHREIRDGTLIDEDKVKLLYNIIKETKADIVLHSGWRFWFCENMRPSRKESQKLVELLAKNQMVIYDKTIDYSTDEIRKSKKFSLVKAKEILTWVREHPEVKSWIVIDDLDLHNDEVEKHQIKTNPCMGLTQEDVYLAITMLNHTKL